MKEIKKIKYTAPIPEIDKEKISKKAGEILKDLATNEFTIIEVEEVIKALKEVTDFKKYTHTI